MAGPLTTPEQVALGHVVDAALTPVFIVVQRWADSQGMHDADTVVLLGSMGWDDLAAAYDQWAIETQALGLDDDDLALQFEEWFNAPFVDDPRDEQEAAR